MKTLKQNDKFIAVDVRNTKYSSDYQLIERTSNGDVTIGEYFTKKDVLEAFSKLNKKEI